MTLKKLDEAGLFKQLNFQSFFKDEGLFYLF